MIHNGAGMDLPNSGVEALRDRLELYARTRLEAALEWAVSDIMPPDEVQFLLSEAGDMVRLGALPPRQLRDWVCSVHPVYLGAALRMAAGELADEAIDVAELEQAVFVRDRAESVRVAYVYAALVREMGPVELDGIAALERAVKSFDDVLGRFAGRKAVEAALGDRRVLQGRRDWTRNLPVRPRAPRRTPKRHPA